MTTDRETSDRRIGGFAVVDDCVQLDWPTVTEMLNRSANAIQDLGLQADQRVAVLGDNASDTLVMYAAAILAGRGTVALNTHLSADEIEYILQDSGAGAIWASSAFAELATSVAARVGIEAIGGASWELSKRAASPVAPRLDIAPQTRLVYTSGTTGYPKGVEVPKSPPATVGDLLVQFRSHPANGLGPHFVAGPLYHGGPSAAIGLLLAGTPTVLRSRFDAEGVLAAIERYAAASTTMVPTHFIRLLRLPDETKKQYDVSSLRMVRQVGAACPVEVKARMIEWFGPVLVETYGGSESSILTSITSSEWLAHRGSVGRPLTRFEVVVVDGDGVVLSAGTPGRLFFRDRTGAGIRYFNDQSKTRDAHLEPGMFTLGDIGYVDAEGWVFVTDRSVDLVLSGGVNIYPAECERVLYERPEVLEAACFGVPDADMGQRLVGFVVLREGVSAEDLLAYCRRRLGPLKAARDLGIVDEIPKTAAEKVDKRALAVFYQDQYV